MIIHDCYTTGKVMRRYYAITHPERKYSNEQALRQSKQDKNIDRNIIRKVLREIHKEAMNMLN